MPDFNKRFIGGGINLMSDYEKLKKIIDEIDILISNNQTDSDVAFQTWKTKAERFLISKYGKNSYEHEKFLKTYFSLPFYIANTPISDLVIACKKVFRRNGRGK